MSAVAESAGPRLAKLEAARAKRAALDAEIEKLEVAAKLRDEFEKALSESGFGLADAGLQDIPPEASSKRMEARYSFTTPDGVIYYYKGGVPPPWMSEHGLLDAGKVVTARLHKLTDAEIQDWIAAGRPVSRSSAR